MKNQHGGQEGFTLVELLVVLGIMGIILSAIFSFFLSNVKTFHRADNQMEAQYHAQMAMSQLVDYIVGAEGINHLPEGAAITYPVSFKVSANDIIDIDHIIQIDYKNNELIFYERQSLSGLVEKTNTFGKNITNLSISPLANNKGVRINITSTKNDAIVSLQNEVFFRNKK